jgi:hypothetical protein
LVWLVKELIPVNCDAAIYGQSGTLKSFIALDLALSIHLGMRALGMLDVKGGDHPPVFYFAGEGFQAMAKKRQLAWTLHHDQPAYDLDRFWFVDGVPLINNDEALLRDLTEMQELLGGTSAALIVIDTLIRALNGMDEDKSNTASQYFSRLKTMRDATGGASTLTVGHFGKDLDRGERGSSSVRANYDVVIWIERHDKNEESGVHTIQLIVSKMKDGEDGKRYWLQSKAVKLP